MSPLAGLAAIWMLVVVSPGPCFVATLHTALQRGRRAGVAVALGIMVGTLVWCTVSLCGLAYVFRVEPVAYTVLRFAGAAYLIAAGIAAFRRPRDDAYAARPTRPFRLGLTTDLSNPKSAVFFAGLFASALPSGPVSTVHVLAVAVVAGLEFFWYVLVAVLASTGRVRRAYTRVARHLDRLTGCVMMGLGLHLALG